MGTSVIFWSLTIFVTGVLGVFFALFERKKIAVEQIVIIAALSSLATVGRLVFSPIPSVQPASFLIMSTGLIFGAEMGFMSGAIAALASNMILGQGLWTPWQMFSWGMMGLSAGLFAGILQKSAFFRCFFGFAWGFLFGWIMNLGVMVFAVGGERSWGLFLATCAASFVMDAAHGAGNALLFGWLGAPVLKVLRRITLKYGL